jgi:hypothetical protein
MSEDPPGEGPASVVGDPDEPAVVIKAVGRARIEELEAEARYHRERYDLYRAKTYGPRPTSESRLRELERKHEGAASRLRRALQAQPPTARRG